MSDIFFQGWSGLGRVVIVSVVAYAALVLMLRVSGKRSLAKLNAFDLIVSVALGSVLATTLLSKTVALAEGLTAFAMLLLLQFLIAWTSSRNEKFKEVISNPPTLLYHQGFLEGPMKAARVSSEELRQVARCSGRAQLTDVASIVLESDGTFSVLTDDPTPLTR